MCCDIIELVKLHTQYLEKVQNYSYQKITKILALNIMKQKNKFMFIHPNGHFTFQRVGLGHKIYKIHCIMYVTEIYRQSPIAASK